MPSTSDWNKFLELHLRRSHGTAFQAFVNEFLGRVYGDDFVPIATQGRRGDRGLDGYLISTRTVYQCYGAENGRSKDPDGVSKKMVKDYEKALKSGIGMKSWKFTHNLISGLTSGMLTTLQELRERGRADEVEVGHFGREGFRTLMAEMSEDDRRGILNVMDASEVNLELLPAALEELLGDLISRFKTPVDEQSSSWKVPLKKFDHNKIPVTWRTTMTGYYQHSPMVMEAFAHYDGEVGVNSVAVGLRELYQSFKLQGLSPDDILFQLRSAIVGDLTDSTNSYRDLAGMAVLSTLFETCVIFEEYPVSTPMEDGHDTAH